MSFWDSFEKVEKALSNEALQKALSAGVASGAPDSLTNGPAMAKEDLSSVMVNITYNDDSFWMLKKVDVEKVKQTMVQFVRENSYGILGDAAQVEGAVGQEENGSANRVTVQMCYYSMFYKYTDAADLVETMDSKGPKERVAGWAAKLLAGNIELDGFRGRADFSNAGVFDGNPAVIPAMPNMPGLDFQVRTSDLDEKAKDQMFAEYGSSVSCIVACGTALTFEQVQDAAVRSAANWGQATDLLVDIFAHAAYNKQLYSIMRIDLAGSPQTGAGAAINKTWTNQGAISVNGSQWLRAKVQPKPSRGLSVTPAAPSVSAASSAVVATPTTFTAAEVYQYRASGVNNTGEGAWSAAGSCTITTTADIVTVTVTPSGSNAQYFNLYRSAAGGTAASAKFIGRIKANGTTAVSFIDLNNKTPGSTDGYLCEWGTMKFCELAPFTRKALAETDLAKTDAFYRFLTLKVEKPRANVILANISA